MPKVPYTVADLRALKGTRQLTQILVKSVEEAAAAGAAGIDLLAVEETLWSPE